MKTKLACWSMLLLSFQSLACGDAPPAVASSPSDSMCVALLKQLRRLEPKVSWDGCRKSAAAPTAPEASSEAPPPPAHVPDPAHCQLLDPQLVDADQCLLEAMSDVSRQLPNPTCPRQTETLAVADLAFLVLTDRHPGLWNLTLPEDVAAGGMIGYLEWIADARKRAVLIDAAREALRK